MADRLKGITIEIGGDTTKLSKSMGEVNSAISGTQNTLKDIDRLLQFDPTNTELLEQKQKNLCRAIEATEAKTEMLKDVLKEVDSGVTTLSPKEIESIKREMAATEQATQKARDELEKMKGASGGVEEVSGKAKEAGESYAALGDIVKGVAIGSLIAKGVEAGVKALADLTLNAGKAADELNTLSKQSGFSAQELQEWGYAAELVDVSVDDMVAAAKKLKKNMASSSQDIQNIFSELGVQTKEGGALRDVNDVFYDTIGALSQIENETQRDTVAMQLFGRGADELAGIIDDGGKALFQLGQEARETGLILSQEALDGANQFNDSMDKMKETASMAMDNLKTSIASSLAPAMEELSQKVNEALSNVNWGDLAQKVAGAAEALSKLFTPEMIGDGVELFSRFCSIIESLSPALEAIGWVLETTIEYFTFLLDIVQKVIDAINEFFGISSKSSTSGLNAQMYGTWDDYNNYQQAYAQKQSQIERYNAWQGGSTVVNVNTSYSGSAGAVARTIGASTTVETQRAGSSLRG